MPSLLKLRGVTARYPRSYILDCIKHDRFPYWPPVILGHEFAGVVTTLGPNCRTIKAGDRVVTSGGIVGTVTGVKDNMVTLRIADKVEVEVLRTAVGTVMSQGKA